MRVQVRHRVRLAAALAAISAVIAIAIIGPAESAGAPTPPCAPSNLALEFINGQGATSHRTWNFALRNVGTTTCHMRGYPGVGLLSSTATLLSVNVVRAASAVRTVTLRPWDRAFFTFSFVLSGPCAHGIFPFGIQVIPPNTSSGLRMYRPFNVCGGTNPSLTAMRSTL